jgi:putative ATP-dependent endonuclease of OLD family
MRLVKAHVKNFRAISDLEVAIGQHTVLVGANGVGKSCVLKGIDKFFAKSANVSIEDFHERNVQDPIEIILTFTDFTDEESDTFSSRIHGNEMSVARVFRSGVGGKDNGKYFGLSLRNAQLQAIRAIEGAVPRRTAFNNLVGTEGFEDLQNAANAAQVDERMLEWESAHPGQCELFRDDGQFLGFSNVARGSLSKYLSFVFVPAVRDASPDSVDAKGSVISQLIELVVKSVVQKRADIVEWRAKAAQEYEELVSPENLGELGNLSDELSETLGIFYSDSRVDLNWKPPEELQVALPIAEVALTEQGYTGPIENKGHGLQRAFIFTLLQHLAKALSVQEPDVPPGAEGEEAPPEVADDAAQPPVEESHTVILAIEEPELYQHPVKQRHIAKVLRQISRGQIPGVMSSTQVMLCSHSPQFVSTEHFDEIRLARREIVQVGSPAQCVVRCVTYAAVNSSLDIAYQTPAGGHTDETLLARLHVIDGAVAEGFFCAVAVLVEGPGDLAAIMAVAQANEIDLEAAGVAILPVGGKTNIDRPLSIFSLLRIPTYAVFDSDSNLSPDDQKVLQNLGIQRLSGEVNPEEFRTHIGNRFASFEENLNVTLQSELGGSYPDQVELAAIKYGMKQKQIVKNPVGLAEIVAGCIANGGTCQTVGAIVNRIAALAQ